MSTHRSILRLYEFLNRKMNTDTETILAQNIYECNFSNDKLFKKLHRITKIEGSNYMAIATFYDLIRTGQYTEDQAKKAGTDVYQVFKAFNNVYISGNKISFSDRMRHNELFCMYLDGKVIIKTNRMKLNSCGKVFLNAISLLIAAGLIVVNKCYLKIDITSFYQKLYENHKKVIENLSKRGIKPFSIACYLYKNHRDIIKKPFMYNWSGLNFFRAIRSSKAFEDQIPEDLKKQIPDTNYWTVLSISSLMTGKIKNIDKRRKAVNQLINSALDSEGVYFLKDYLTVLKLVKNNTIERSIEINNIKNVAKENELKIKELLANKNSQIPTNEQVEEAIKFQFMISRILDVDFSSNRKDHLVLFKENKQRLFDIL